MTSNPRRLEYEVHEYSGAGSQSTSYPKRCEYEVREYSGPGSQSGGYQKLGGYGNGSYGGGGYSVEEYPSGGFESSGGYESDGGAGQTGAWRARVGVLYHGGSPGSLGDPVCTKVMSPFPPGTDPKLIECFNRIDKDRKGLIRDQELLAALSTSEQRLSLRTVHLLMFMFTGSNSKVLGPRGFVPLVRSLQTWKAAFQKYDRNRYGRLDKRELKEALMSIGFVVSPFVIKLLMSKNDKSGWVSCAVQYDYFIECCVVVQGLTKKFRVKEGPHAYGTARFTYDEFLLGVLPFIVA